jgi:GDPmannose 4,6-dehydratase
VDYLLGDPNKAEKELGWKAETRWDALARLMVDADIRSLDDQLSGRVITASR